MDDALYVCLLQGSSQSSRQAGSDARRPGDAIQTIGQAAALDKLEREIWQTVAFANLVSLDDVGVLQQCNCFGFGAESCQLLLTCMAARETILRATTQNASTVPV
jgi:hypothetical protein